ncbi:MULTISPECIES: YdcF family protein [Anaerolinea]|uniref:YdcF family protein n=1 Tax=Anaerolinea TaxID=233189 RepID=UPI00263785E8|nr:YdcF family protein [Anaerolinea thermophila]
MKHKHIISIGLILAGIGLFCLCSALFVLGALGNFLVVNEPLQPADAVVVLSGGELDRLEKAVNIIKAEKARYLILTETQETTESGWKTADYLASEAHQRGIPVPQIVITRKVATNTQEEAIATLDILKERGWNTLIVVTDPYHTRRSQLIFQQVLSKEPVEFIVVSSKEPRLNAWLWYLDRDSRNSVVRELISLLAFLGKK